ncbi:hypothetical protein [Actinoalloteichus hymeniacidonis]|uniref:Uncharacterized protein n=1 Tax=Actinoalloteichus hymeniacidonis TaxID=340345 RepID=A0AAC9HV69_9PSEU|nr:hypothetical protein [Actinoalloteichus hymeniacidonis]AOS65756.1 hypothetical protein TL08_24890 [Actinoalloteichus hymeniacidonis]MBB5906154.1 hypothetical protein [Actinoalloteichus hymeniacidonis]
MPNPGMPGPHNRQQGPPTIGMLALGVLLVCVAITPVAIAGLPAVPEWFSGGYGLLAPAPLSGVAAIIVILSAALITYGRRISQVLIILLGAGFSGLFAFIGLIGDPDAYPIALPISAAVGAVALIVWPLVPPLSRAAQKAPQRSMAGPPPPGPGGYPGPGGPVGNPAGHPGGPGPGPQQWQGNGPRQF